MNYKDWKEEYDDLLTEKWKESGRKDSFEVFCFNLWNERNYEY